MGSFNKKQKLSLFGVDGGSGYTPAIVTFEYNQNLNILMLLLNLPPK